MAVYREDILEIDLTTGNVFRSFFHHQLGEGDAAGDVFGIRAVRNGNEVALDGLSCVGYFERADGTTVVIGDTTYPAPNWASRSGGKAWVKLPAACYAVEGGFRLSIKLVGTGTAMTARIIEGTITGTTTATLVDPGSVIPDVSGLTTYVQRIEAAAEIIGGSSIEATLLEGTRYRIDVTFPGEGA